MPSSSSMSSSSSPASTTIVTYVCCKNLSAIEYDNSYLGRGTVEITKDPFEGETGEITVYIVNDVNATARKRIIVKISPEGVGYSGKACFGLEDGSLTIKRGHGGSEIIGYVLDTWPKLYWTNPRHCQWVLTSIMLYGPTIIGEVYLTQAPTAGLAIPEEKEDFLPGKGTQENTILQTQIVPGMLVSLEGSFSDGDELWEENFDAKYFATNALVGGTIKWKETDPEENYPPSKYVVEVGSVWCWAYSSDYTPWEVGDWVFLSPLPVSIPNAEKWTQDSRINITDITRGKAFTQVTPEEFRFTILPIKINKYGHN